MPDAFDLIVIGSGPAGEKGAAQAAYHGRVALVERETWLGGAAVGNAGIPTKTLRETASYITGFRRREIYGVAPYRPSATPTNTPPTTAWPGSVAEDCSDYAPTRAFWVQNGLQNPPVSDDGLHSHEMF
ncbi:MAG: FAD-dependent oxidoreductase [Actinomycetota bacterium]|nr:FAD-dependent oxidoreductase [Actinomycetota bacterium]